MVKNGHRDNKQRYRCKDCQRTFGPTYGTPLYGLHNSAEEVAPQVIPRTRQRTRGQVGCAFVSDGNPLYAEQIKKVYRDFQRTGKPGRPPLVLREDVGLTREVKQREGGRMVGLSVRAVSGEAAERAVCVCEERRGRRSARPSQLLDP